MKRINILVIYLISTLFFTSSLQAKTYFCNPTNGIIENPGTKDLPWPSLQDVLASDKQLSPGDTLFLMEGNHGNPEISGINPNYIYIYAAPGHNPVITHLDIAKKEPATKWHLKNITFSGENSEQKEFVSFYKKSMFIKIEECNFYSSDSTSSWDLDDWKNKTKSGILLEGSRHNIEHNSFNNLATAINVKANNCTIKGNKITAFTNFGILCEGNNNIFINNLIKNHVYTGFNAAAFKAGNSATPNASFRKNILLGNVIVDYTSPDKKHIAPLMGIVGFDALYDGWVIENNLIVTDHWHGITFFNIKNSLIINNTVIDPYIDTKYPNLKKDLQTKSYGPVRIWVAAKGENNESVNNHIVNNLASDYFFDDSVGYISNNIKVASTYDEMDKYFEQWDYLNFYLRDSCLAVNAGDNRYAPKIDANGTKRPLGKTVNTGAYEYSFIQSGDQILQLPAEKTDQEIRSKNQKADWLGQKSIRVGGSGTNFDAAMIIPFALPPLPDGFIIKSAKFSVNLEKIDNSPKGSINLHGLIPRKIPTVLQTDYYQGDVMGDLNARPIQPDFLGKERGGMVQTSEEGNKVLASYLNSLYQAGSQGGDYVFLRLSPNSKDVQDYHRWVFSSANADDFDKRPVLEVVLGRIEDVEKKENIVKTLIVRPDILYDGNFSINAIGFDQKEINFQVLNQHNKIVHQDIIKKAGKNIHKYESKGQIELKTGKYNLKINNKLQKFMVW
ncbi:MAG: right-handed parallel beta-helix repeat-containing protein [Bacteroidota bacterium]